MSAPTLFQAAISAGDEYEDAVRTHAVAGATVDEAIFDLTITDRGLAASPRDLTP